MTGKRLGGATAVRFGSRTATGLVRINDGSLKVEVRDPGTGTVDVTVVTPEGVSPATSSARYAYTDMPVLTSSSPKIVELLAVTRSP